MIDISAVYDAAVEAANTDPALQPILAKYEDLYRAAVRAHEAASKATRLANAQEAELIQYLLEH
jgi:hypothetical protein